MRGLLQRWAEDYGVYLFQNRKRCDFMCNFNELQRILAQKFFHDNRKFFDSQKF